jgi:hypothetical protein
MKEIGIAKVRPFSGCPTLCSRLSAQFVVPSMALKVVDRAMQTYGAEGLSQDQELAFMWAWLRTLRIADVSVLSFYYYCKTLMTARNRVLMKYVNI